MTEKTKETRQLRYDQAKTTLEKLQSDPLMTLLTMAPESLRQLISVMTELPEEQQRLDTRISESGTTLEELGTKIAQREERLKSLDEAVVAARSELMAAAKG